jgi:hypothetical protein
MAESIEDIHNRSSPASEKIPELQVGPGEEWDVVNAGSSVTVVGACAGEKSNDNTNSTIYVSPLIIIILFV